MNGQETYEKMLNVTSSLENTNIKDILFLLIRMAKIKMTGYIQSMLVKIKKKKTVLSFTTCRQMF